MRKPAVIAALLVGVAVVLIALASARVPLFAPLEVVVPVIPLMAAAALAWFVFQMCLAPRLKLKKLQRIRVRQGRRHPLA